VLRTAFEQPDTAAADLVQQPQERLNKEIRRRTDSLNRDRRMAVGTPLERA
jgi:hypothetical protein